jgi:hypothetical protein
MAPLPANLRKQLEKAIVQAREQAEVGARQALEALAVHHHEPHGSMTPEQRKLRNRLRAHGRQFGDRRDDQGGQRIERLLREVAYEHWHRMLFARFLAENDLLIEPSNQVAVSLGDIEDLARERGLDPWSMAASFAQRMLPQIFRTDDPVLQVVLPPETKQALQQLVLGLDELVFTADDALGWTYQFWQSAEKDAVNARVKSGEKISGETLPAVTQLFTEHYMVQFLLHNTLGAWHAGKVLAARPELATTAQSEGELRAAVALPGYTFDYLRFVREGDGPWRPAAGVFAAWPRTAKDLKVLDPCCGSGHFLVAGFELLAALRQHDEALRVAEAGAAVLRDNLFGLELDARCVQIAAFALAMAAWKRAGAVVELPALQVACCGVGPSGTKEQWLKLAEQAAAKGGMPVKRDLLGKEESLLSVPIRNALEDLYLLFQKAPELGSLIDPKGTAAGLYQADFKTVQPLLERVLQSESAGEDAQEQAVAAQGMAKAAAILGQSFTLVVTNVPYLGRGAQGEVLKAFAEQHYPDAKADLATVFVQRAFGWLGKVGTMAVVTPQNWLFLTSYRKLREKLLKQRTLDLVARLGPRAFETIGGHVVNVALITCSAAKAGEPHGMGGVDVSAVTTPTGKAALLRGDSVVPAGTFEAAARGDALGEEGEEEPSGSSGNIDGSVKIVAQAEQLTSPDARIGSLPTMAGEALLRDHGSTGTGMQTFDLPHFLAKFWEVPASSHIWLPSQSTVDATVPFGGISDVVRWENGSGELYRAMEAMAAGGYHSGIWRAGSQFWGQEGVLVSLMGSLPCSRYLGIPFNQNAGALVPIDPSILPALWCAFELGEIARLVRRIDQSLKVTNGTIGKVTFELARWQRVAAEKYPHGLPEPQTNDPTQWLFHGHPAGMTAAGRIDNSPLGIPDITGPGHPSLICRTPNPVDVLQVATARLLGYRWPAELDEMMRLDTAQRAWATRSRELVHHADADGIVCLNPTRGEPSAADRLRELLQAAFGPRWYPETEKKLLDIAAKDGRPAASLDAWLRDEFFAAHCKLFHDRPFVWHIWDGLEKGFHALVNYHKLAGPNGEGRRTLELLTFTYLNDWIERQRADIKAGQEGADARLVAALRLQDELKKILTGEPPYDLFVRWKPLHQQPLGWDPDINDGVRLNIRPFLLAADMKQKGAGLLRCKVSMKWTKDRGKEPEQLRPRDQFPWFWSCNPESPQHRVDYVAGKVAQFDGVRWNDLHYSRSAKQAAREARDKASP